MIIERSIEEPVRQGLSYQEKWNGPDNGLIACWERGREQALENPEWVAAARRGELIPLVWKGGVEKELVSKKKIGTHSYYAHWLGLRGEDLWIDTDKRFSLCCTRFGVTVTYTGVFEEYANA